MPGVSESFVRSGRECRGWKGMVTITHNSMFDGNFVLEGRSIMEQQFERDARDKTSVGG